MNLTGLTHRISAKADPMTRRLVIVGGGAAGFFTAVNAARLNPSLRVLILEKSSKVLSKVKVSGGGRCNVTHACYSVEDLVNYFPRGGRFLKKAFFHFGPNDTVNWFLERGIRLKTERDGRMFPVTDSSQTIMDCLVNEAQSHGVLLRLQAEVKRIVLGQNQATFSGPRGRFQIQLSSGELLEADMLSICTGGNGKMRKYEWLTDLGHSIVEPVASLFSFNTPGTSLIQLTGISVEKVKATIAGTSWASQGALLITHWGVSGPAILRLSAWAARALHAREYKFNLVIKWLHSENETSLLSRFRQLRASHGGQKAVSHNPFGLPQRLWSFLVSHAGIAPEATWALISRQSQQRLIKSLLYYSVQVEGKTTYKEEFVTAGGIRLDEIDPHTMESKKVSGLFFCGEVMDVDGVTGGFNFQHAWTSGMIAARTAAKLSSGHPVSM